MSLEFSECGKLINEFDVVAFEMKHDLVLPIEYRQFLLRHNGGVPLPCEFDFRSGPYGDSAIDRFLSLDESQKHNLETLLSQFTILEKRLSPHLIPIAEDTNGNFLCIGVQAEQAGKVFFWNHEEENDEDEPERNIYFLASSFDEFLSSLQTKEHPEPRPQPSWMRRPQAPQPVVQLSLWDEETS